MSKADDTLKLQDKTALVTYSPSASVRAIALRLSELGVDVALAGPPSNEGERLAQQIMDQREVREEFGRGVFIPTDFREPKQLQDAIQKTAEFFGTIDIYVDTQVLSRKSPLEAPTALTELDDFLSFQLKAPMLLTQHILKFFKARKRGRIIYLVSDVSRYGVPENSVSAATRNGLISFSKNMARELMMDNITVNCIALGPTEDFLLQRYPEAKSVAAAQEELLKILPKTRMIDPSEVANVVSFIASPLSSAITGQSITVSGGITMY